VGVRRAASGNHCFWHPSQLDHLCGQERVEPRRPLGSVHAALRRGEAEHFDQCVWGSYHDPPSEQFLRPVGTSHVERHPRVVLGKRRLRCPDIGGLRLVRYISQHEFYRSGSPGLVEPVRANRYLPSRCVSNCRDSYRRERPILWARDLRKGFPKLVLAAALGMDCHLQSARGMALDPGSGWPGIHANRSRVKRPGLTRL